MKKAIILGASSGIGKALATVLSQNGYAVGLMGRRVELLAELQKELPAASFVQTIDVSQTEKARARLTAFIGEMNGVDLIVLSAGVGFINPELDWEKEEATIATNVTGFAAMANVAVKHFLAQGSGHLVGISSIAAIRGAGDAAAYNASKAFISNYLEGLQQKFAKSKLLITVTDVKPGFVDTAMAQGDGLFWVATPEKAARQIYDAIQSRRPHVYVTKRWRLIGTALRLLPSSLYNRL